MWLLRAVVILVLLLWPQIAGAQGGGDVVNVYVVDTNGAPLAMAELGCSMTDDPAPSNYVFERMCESCSQTTCELEAGEWRGVYFVYSMPGATSQYTADPHSGTYGAWPSTGAPWDERQNFVLWPAEFEGTHTVTFTISSSSPTPTPIPTLTPIPYLGPSSVNFVEGFGAGFDESYGQLSGYGVMPDFGLDHTQWLFAARKWLQAINQGNLLYVMGGVLLAVLVLRWAVDRLKNPR